MSIKGTKKALPLQNLKILPRPWKFLDLQKEDFVSFIFIKSNYMDGK